MITVRWIERLWNAKKHRQLATELLANRPEGLVDAFGSKDGPTQHPTAPAASLAVIRLDELAQSHTPVCRTLLRTLIALQDSDGGWGDLFTSALASRALLCSGGAGEALHRAMGYFELLQKPEGIWPREPVRRLPADALQSALILFELGDAPLFQSRVRVEAALRWFDDHSDTLDAETRLIYSHAKLRCRVRKYAPLQPAGAGLWS